MESVALVIGTKLREQACQVPAGGLNLPVLVKGMQQAGSAVETSTLNVATAYK